MLRVLALLRVLMDLAMANGGHDVPEVVEADAAQVPHVRVENHLLRHGVRDADAQRAHHALDVAHGMKCVHNHDIVHGDLRSAKSTGGCCAHYKDNGYTHVPLPHWSKLQDVAAPSTADSEYIAMARAVKHTAIPRQMLLEDLYNHPVLLEVRMDNSAALAVARRISVASSRCTILGRYCSS